MNYDHKEYLKKAGLAIAGTAIMIWGAATGWKGLNDPVYGTKTVEVEEGEITTITHPTGQKYKIRTEDNNIRKNLIARIERENGRADTAQIDEFIDDKTSYPDIGFLTKKELFEATTRYEATGIKLYRTPVDVYDQQRKYMETKSKLYKELEQLEKERYRQLKQEKVKAAEAEQQRLMGY